MSELFPTFFIFSSVSNDEKYTGNKERWKKVNTYRNYKPKLKTFFQGTDREYTVDLEKFTRSYDMYLFPGENRNFFQDIPEAEYYETLVTFEAESSKTIPLPATRFTNEPIVTLELVDYDVEVALMVTDVTLTTVTFDASAAFTGSVMVRAVYADSYPARIGWDLISAVQDSVEGLDAYGALFDAEYQEYPAIKIKGLDEYYATAYNTTSLAIIDHQQTGTTLVSPKSGSSYIDFFASASGDYYSNSMYYLAWDLTSTAIDYMETTPPIAANLTLYLDPASPDTTITSGTVEQLGDLSGNDNHFDQSTVYSRPVVIKRKEYGNKQIISFNREKQFLESVSSFLPSSGSFTIYVYSRTPGPSGGAGVIFGATSGTAISAYAMFRLDASVFSRFNSDNSNYHEARSNTDNTDIVTLAATVNPLAITSPWAKEFYEDGTDVGPTFSTNGSPYPRKLSPLTYGIGSRNSIGSEALEGEIGTVLIYAAEHSQEEVKLVTEWLEWKFAAAAEPDFELDTPAISGHLQIMLDPSGSNTTVVDGAVSQLGDESGSSLHGTQATDYKRPPYLEFDPDFGGHPSIFGDGYTTGMATPVFQPGLNADGDDTFWTVYGVIKTGITGDFVRIFGQSGAGGNGRFYIAQQSSGSQLVFQFSNPGGQYTGKIYNSSPNTVYRFAASWDISDGTDALPLLWVNGADTGLGYGSTNASNDTEFDATSVGIGSNETASSLHFDGKIGFLAGYKSRHSEEMIRAMDEWLVWKYESLDPTLSASLEEARYDEIIPPITANMSLNLNPNGDSTVTAVSGAFTVCSQLGDESGNARHATQGTVDAQPIVNLADSDFNGKNSLSFDGIDDGLVVPTFQPGDGRTYWSVYGVFKTGSSTSEGIIFGTLVGGGTGRFSIRQRLSDTRLRFYFSNPGGSYTFKDVTGISANTVYRFAAIWDISDGPDAVPRVYLDGVEVGTYSGSSASNDTEFDSIVQGVGADEATGSQFLDGKIAAIIAYDQAHSGEMVKTMDKWLAWNFIP